jgi:hypothetical protein
MIIEINPLPSSVTSYNVFYKKVNDSIWSPFNGNPISSTQLITNLNGLDENSLYNVKVVSKCGLTDGSATTYPTAIMSVGCPTAQQYNPTMTANSAVVYFPVTPNISHIASLSAKLILNNTVLATQTILGSNLSNSIINANSFTFSGLAQATTYTIKFVTNFIDGQMSSSICDGVNQPPCCSINVTTLQSSTCPQITINTIIS